MNLFFLKFADERRILFHRCISYQEMHFFYVTLFLNILCGRYLVFAHSVLGISCPWNWVGEADKQ